MKIAILGGGLAGLAAADVLTRDNDITIYEKNSQLGGLAASFEHRGKKIPLHYHHIFDHDYVTKKYLKSFGLDSTWKKVKMAICVNRKMYNFTDPLSLLGFNYLSLFGRIRYGLFGLFVYTFMNPKKIPNQLDAQKWLKKVAGKEVTNKLFVPLYAENKFNIPLRKISARQFAHRLKAKEATGLFGYPKKGLDEFIQRFENSLKKRKVKILKGEKIENLDCKNKTIDGKSYDKIIITLPIPEFLKIQKNFDEEEVKRISKINYCPCVSVVFGTKKMLSNHYWLNILKEKTHMLMQHSYLFDAYDSKVNWILRYGGSEEDLELTKDMITDKYLADVRKYFPKADIQWVEVFKEKYASPVYDKDFHLNMPKIKNGDIYFAGIAVSYPMIRNMNTALILGRKVGKEVQKDSI